MQSQTVFRTVFLPETGFVRLPIVLKVIPVSRASWWQGIREGRYPRGYKLGGTRSTGWRVEDIRALIQKLSADEGASS